MKNFVVIALYKDSTDTHLFCVKADSGTKAVTQAKLRYIDNYEAVMPVHRMIKVEDVAFRVYEITEESFK